MIITIKKHETISQWTKDNVNKKLMLQLSNGDEIHFENEEIAINIFIRIIRMYGHTNLFEYYKNRS